MQSLSEARSIESIPVKPYLRYMRDTVTKIHRFNDRKRESLLYTLDPVICVVVTMPVNRAVDSLLYRPRLEIACTQHLFRWMRQVASPDCGTPRVPETVNHLLQCPKYSQQRRPLQSRLAVLDSTPLPLSRALGPWPVALRQQRALVAILDFLKDTDLATRY